MNFQADICCFWTLTVSSLQDLCKCSWCTQENCTFSFWQFLSEGKSVLPWTFNTYTVEGSPYFWVLGVGHTALAFVLPLSSSNWPEVLNRTKNWRLSWPGAQNINVPFIYPPHYRFCPCGMVLPEAENHLQTAPGWSVEVALRRCFDNLSSSWSCFLEELWADTLLWRRSNPKC